MIDDGDFRSDNVAGVSPAIMAAMATANTGTDISYGDDATSHAVNARFSTLFGAAVTVFPVSTGTAANALALAASVRPMAASIATRRPISTPPKVALWPRSVAMPAY